MKFDFARDENSIGVKFSSFLIALAAHVLIIFCLINIKGVGNIGSSSSRGGAQKINVKVQTPNSNRSLKSEPRTSGTSLPKTVSKPTKSKLKQSPVQTTLATRNVTDFEQKIEVDNFEPIREKDTKIEADSDSALSSSLVNRNLSHLFPNKNSDIFRNQVAIGEADNEIETRKSNFTPELVDQNSALPEKPNIVTTRFDALAYTMELEKRFVSAWGAERYLPSGSDFVGRTGETIYYNVIINRDGTLRRIVNVSALTQTGRNFSSVDLLIQEFARSVFPMNPIPDKIQDDPFILRWPIVYMGARYVFN